MTALIPPARRNPMTSDLHLGVIGSGCRGLLAGLAHLPGNGSRILACCDPESGVLDQAKQSYGSDLFITTDYRELLEQDLDAVFITSPDYCHEEQALAALAAGKAVYLEKPMALSTEGCDRILDAAHRSGCTLFLGHNMRHMPFVQLMRGRILGGDIGEVKSIWCRHFVGHGGDYYFKDWHADRRTCNGLLLQKGCHDIDIIHWLAGAYTTRAQAMGALHIYGDPALRRPDPLPRPPRDQNDTWPPRDQTLLNPVVDVEDLSLVNLALENRALAGYQQCHYTPDYWRSYTVIGSEGRMENRGDCAEGAEIHLWNRRHQGYAEPDLQLSVPTLDGEHGGADARIVQEFLDCVRGLTQPSTPPFAARQAVAAACAATHSLRHGGIPVELPCYSPPLPNNLLQPEALI